MYRSIRPPLKTEGGRSGVDGSPVPDRTGRRRPPAGAEGGLRPPEVPTHRPPLLHRTAEPIDLRRRRNLVESRIRPRTSGRNESARTADVGAPARPSRQRIHREEPPVLRDREAVRHAGHVVGDDTGAFGLTSVLPLDPPLDVVRQGAGVVEEDPEQGP